MTEHTHASNGKVSDSKTSTTNNKKIPKSKTTSIDQILHLQRTVGNQAVLRLVQNGTIRPKLSISNPADAAEIEADRTADKVMGMTDSQINPSQGIARQPEEGEEDLQGKIMRTQEPAIRRDYFEKVARQPEEDEMDLQGKMMRVPDEEEAMRTKVMRSLDPIRRDYFFEVARQPEDEEELLQGKFDSPKDNPMDGLESQINAAKGSGSPLDNPTKQFMESRFGNDFGGVKIHRDSQASNLNKAVNARAFTTGNDIFFREGQYNPNSDDGKRLLAHELTHTVQQTGGKAQRKKGAEKKTIQRKILLDGNEANLGDLLKDAKDMKERVILANWGWADEEHDFKTSKKKKLGAKEVLKNAVSSAKSYVESVPALYTAANLKFMTKDSGRLATLYFINGNQSGRIRQQHGSGPLVKDQTGKKDYFFSDKQKMNAFLAAAKEASKNRKSEPVLSSFGGTNRPTNGAFHLEVTRKGGVITSTHISGGLCDTGIGGYDDIRIKAVYQKAIGYTT